MERTAFVLRGDNRIELPTSYRITQEFSFWRNYGLGDLLNIYIPGHSIKIFANSTFINPNTEIKLIVNDEATGVTFPLSKGKMERKNRHKLVFEIDEALGEVSVTFDGAKKAAKIKPLPDIRMKDLRVVDWECPSIVLWDMKIEYDGEIQHHWPFLSTPEVSPMMWLGGSTPTSAIPSGPSTNTTFGLWLIRSRSMHLR